MTASDTTGRLDVAELAELERLLGIASPVLLQAFDGEIQYFDLAAAEPCWGYVGEVASEGFAELFVALTNAAPQLIALAWQGLALREAARRQRGPLTPAGRCEHRVYGGLAQCGNTTRDCFDGHYLCYRHRQYAALRAGDEGTGTT